MILFIVFLVGLVFGSFFNVCIYRIPRQESIIVPPSRCNSCGHRLGVKDLFPVFSYIFLRGRCRYCGSQIGLKDTASELAVGILFVLAYIKFGISWKLLSNLVLLSILYIAALIDLKHQIIPDGLVATGLVFAVVFILSDITVLWLDGLIGLGVGGGFFLAIAFLSELLLKKEGMGGGDIKLMAMIGAFLGWKLTVLALLLSVYAGGIIGGVLILTGIKKRSDRIPFGPFIALGTAMAVFFGSNIIEWYLHKILF